MHSHNPNTIKCCCHIVSDWFSLHQKSTVDYQPFIMTENPTSNTAYANPMVKGVHQHGKHFLNREICKLGKLGKNAPWSASNCCFGSMACVDLTCPVAKRRVILPVTLGVHVCEAVWYEDWYVCKCQSFCGAVNPIHLREWIWLFIEVLVELQYKDVSNLCLMLFS